MEKLEFKALNTGEDVCKWINQFNNLIEVKEIVYDSSISTFIVFYYWKPKDAVI